MGIALAQPATATPLQVPFDYSRSEIGVDVAINGTPAYMILDTGVDPSVVDLKRSEALRLKIDRTNGGEASGFGDGKGAAVFPTSIRGLAIHGHDFAPVEALASDLSALSRHYGRQLDGVLGYSFLSDKIVLIDYPGKSLNILDVAREAKSLTRTCRKRWTTQLKTTDNMPVIHAFRLGAATGPISLDTGSNGGIALFRSALDLPGIRVGLKEAGTITHSGAKGEATARSFAFGAPVGFGPFTLPAGQTVSVYNEPGSSATRVANVGNVLFAAMKLKMLLDYRGRTMTFYGDCR